MGWAGDRREPESSSMTSNSPWDGFLGARGPVTYGLPNTPGPWTKVALPVSAGTDLETQEASVEPAIGRQDLLLHCLKISTQ